MKSDSMLTVRFSNQSIRIMSAVLTEVGIPLLPLFRQAELDPLLAHDPHGEISGPEELRFQQVFVAATRHLPGLWLKTGLRYRLMSYGPLGLAVMAAANIAEGLRVLDAFQALTYSLMIYRVETEDGAPTAMVADDSMAPPDLWEFLHERALGSATMFLHDMRQQPFPLERIESVLVRPPNWMECERLLSVPVAFGQGRTRWVFKPGIGAEPLPMGSPLLEETYQRMCTQLIGQARVTDPFVARVYAVLVRSARTMPSVIDTARQLAVSERTLHRRLALQGLRFGDIMDQVRQQRACDLLQRSMLTVEQIADMLGFQEPASFSRAFKRWTGTTALKWRHHAVGRRTTS